MRGKELTASRDGRHKILNYFAFLQNIRIFLLARMPLISLRSPINISLMVKVAKRKPLCNEVKHTIVSNVLFIFECAHRGRCVTIECKAM